MYCSCSPERSSPTGIPSLRKLSRPSSNKIKRKSFLKLNCLKTSFFPLSIQRMLYTAAKHKSLLRFKKNICSENKKFSFPVLYSFIYYKTITNTVDMKLNKKEYLKSRNICYLIRCFRRCINFQTTA